MSYITYVQQALLDLHCLDGKPHPLKAEEQYAKALDMPGRNCLFECTCQYSIDCTAQCKHLYFYIVFLGGLKRCRL